MQPAVVVTHSLENQVVYLIARFRLVDRLADLRIAEHDLATPIARAHERATVALQVAA